MQNVPLSMAQQACILYALVNGYLDDVEIPKVQGLEKALHDFMDSNHPEILKRITEAKELNEDIEASLKGAIEEFKASVPY